MSAQDHKRAFDDDPGPNTGGMGAFSPSPLLTPALEAQILREIVNPVIDAMRPRASRSAASSTRADADGRRARRSSSSTSASAIPRRRSSCRACGPSSRRCCSRRPPTACRAVPASRPRTSRTSASCSPRAAIPITSRSARPSRVSIAPRALDDVLVFQASTRRDERSHRHQRRPSAHRGRPRRRRRGRHRARLRRRRARSRSTPCTCAATSGARRSEA